MYSYGVVLLELITRKKAVDPSFMGEIDVVGWVRSHTEVKRIVDSNLADELLDSNIREEVISVLSVAMRCTEREASRRPTMRDVVRQLLYVAEERK